MHTNLGRAPLSEEAIRAISATASVYSNLEFDLAGGTRSRRLVHVDEMLLALTGAESVHVVNNNAAAVFLCLAGLARITSYNVCYTKLLRADRRPSPRENAPSSSEISGVWNLTSTFRSRPTTARMIPTRSRISSLPI